MLIDSHCVELTVLYFINLFIMQTLDPFPITNGSDSEDVVNTNDANVGDSNSQIRRSQTIFPDFTSQAWSCGCITPSLEATRRDGMFSVGLGDMVTYYVTSPFEAMGYDGVLSYAMFGGSMNESVNTISPSQHDEGLA